MTREIQVCKAHETLSRAAQLMWERDCGFIPVVASNGDGALVGVITDRDIAMATYIKANRRSRSRFQRDDPQARLLSCRRRHSKGRRPDENQSGAPPSGSRSERTCGWHPVTQRPR